MGGREIGGGKAGMGKGDWCMIWSGCIKFQDGEL